MCHNMLFAILRSGSILYVYILFQIKLQTSDLDKKTYQNFISANEGGILKLFFFNSKDKEEWSIQN